MFTGNSVRAQDVAPFINHPANALNLQSDTHDSMDKKLAWGIEARRESNEVRVMRLCDADPDITSIDKILFPIRSAESCAIFY
jgi:hypothetical protein